MTDRYDGNRSAEDEALTGGEAIVRDLLIEDGLAWRRSVPANDRLNAAARALVDEAVTPPRQRDQEVARSQPRVVTIDAGPRPATRRTLAAAAVAAVLVVSLLGTILYSRAGENSYNPGGAATATIVPTVTAAAITTTIRGPAARYIRAVVTAHAVDKQYVPIDVTSHFHAGDTVYVVAFVRGLPKDQTHTLTVQWYLGNLKLDLPGTARTSVVVDGGKHADLNVAFALHYPTGGQGHAQIYWDLPSCAHTDLCLALEVSFEVQ